MRRRRRRRRRRRGRRRGGGGGGGEKEGGEKEKKKCVVSHIFLRINIHTSVNSVNWFVFFNLEINFKIFVTWKSCPKRERTVLFKDGVSGHDYIAFVVEERNIRMEQRWN